MQVHCDVGFEFWSAGTLCDVGFMCFFFSTFGELKTVRLPKKGIGGAHRGFGFIDFLTKQDAKVGASVSIFVSFHSQVVSCKTTNRHEPVQYVHTSNTSFDFVCVSYRKRSQRCVTVPIFTAGGWCWSGRMQMTLWTTCDGKPHNTFMVKSLLYTQLFSIDSCKQFW